MIMCRQLYALLRKNFLLKVRSPFSTLVELLLPVLLMTAMVGIRASISRGNYDASSHLADGLSWNDKFVFAEQSDISLFQGGQPSERIAFMPAESVGPVLAAFQAEYPALASLAVPFSNVAEFDSYLSSYDYGVGAANPYYQAGISFEYIGSASDPTYSYSLHINFTDGSDPISDVDTSQPAVDVTQTTYDPQWTVLFNNRALFLQEFVESWILKQQLNASAVAAGYPNLTPSVKRNFAAIPFPTPPYISDSFASLVSTYLGLLFTVVFLWPTTRIVKVLVEEKETRIKEGMKMMGLAETSIWLSWLIMYFAIFLVMCILITVVSGSSVFKYSDKVIIFFFFFLFTWSVFAFCYMVSGFFNSARTGSTFSALLFLGCFFPYFAVYGSNYGMAGKTVACLSSPIAFSLGAVAIIDWESAGVGIQNSNISTEINNFNLSTALGFFILDFFIYMALGLYFDRVLAAEWGTPEPWNFLCTKKWWCPPKIDADHPLNNQMNDLAASRGLTDVEQKDHEQWPDYIEPVSAEVKSQLGVRIHKLRKEFMLIDSDKPFVAVNDISLDMYQGQILALLGHNGAGKTTVINMLSGMMPPTSGGALIYGHSIQGSMESIRKIMGVCPQHDILFDDLTVKEHLELYSRIKGVPEDQIPKLVQQMIEQVGLTEKVNYTSAGLSGGMKRKLSVGIALIGDSKIVFLDEPTSGMDPYSRRATWDLLKNKKEGRVIILTTHFMDEADQLGDRIAIMAKGQIKCCGSSLFLKGRYGVGYSLVITKREHCNEVAIGDLIQSRIAGAEELSNAAGELSYRLPLNGSQHFADVFDQFDSRAAELGIQSYGISVTTLEEVFLRVGHDLEAEPKAVAKQQSLHRASQINGKSLHVLPALGPSEEANTRAMSGGDVNPSWHEKTANADGAADCSTPPSPLAAGLGHENPTGIPLTHTVAVKYSDGARHRRSISVLNRKLEVKFDRGNMRMRHFYALFFKRFTDAKRNKRIWCFTIVIPFLVMLLGLGVIQSFGQISSPTVTMSFNDNPFNHPAPMPYYDASLASSNSSVLPIFNSTAVQNSPALRSNAALELVSTATSAAAMNDFLVQQLVTQPNKLSTYGAIVANVLRPNVATLVDNSVIMFNTTALFGLPTHFNLMNQMMLQSVSGNSSATIHVSNHPFPQTANSKTLNNSLSALFIAIAFAFIPAGFIHYTVSETQIKSKHQQQISGVSALSYWTANYAWDFCNYMLPGMLCLLCLAIYSRSEYIGGNTGATFVAIVLHGLSIISFTYMCSFMFRSPSTAQNVMLIFYILIGAFLLVASLILDSISSTSSGNKQAKWFYRLFPSFCFGEAMTGIVIRSSSTVFGSPQSLWDMDVTGNAMAMMAWEVFAYFGVVLLIERIQASPKLFSYFTRSEALEYSQFPDEDSDVLAEKARLTAPGYVKDTITLDGMRKVYPVAESGSAGKPKVAVHELHLGIPRGQCFGFLGINGAGKTTTLKMLTNDIYPTAGEAWFNNVNISNAAEVRRLIGYCPQFDALIPTLTAREHLTLFARIKGVDESVIPEYVESLIGRLDLQEGIADRMCAGYSGGNKRKLCVGIALIGNPPIVFLDEPSTGMDPGSRRSMWDLIAATMKDRSVILTTHSMEECEALCGRVGIMVGGRLRCLGTAQHLKEKHGDGFQVECNAHGLENQQQIQAFMKDVWPGTELLEWHDQNMKFRIPKLIGDRMLSIGSMFRLMEQSKDKFGVREYSVSETSLEQIFIHFARQQEERSGMPGVERMALTPGAVAVPIV